jgi:8-oxo-dGTP pyrophosphatase MutT (NUDIX family)
MITNNKIINYCLGYAFFSNYVVLIEKNRPDWQKNKLNGIGGKVEEGETGQDAMTREWVEETLLPFEKERWVYAGMLIDPILQTNNASVQVFYTTLKHKEFGLLKQINNDRTDGCEKIVIVDIYSEIYKLHHSGKSLYNVFDHIIQLSGYLYATKQNHLFMRSLFNNNDYITRIKP